MKFIILCGGIDRSTSLPNPLNYVNGKHLIEYIIENIIWFIRGIFPCYLPYASKHLYKYITFYINL